MDAVVALRARPWAAAVAGAARVAIALAVAASLWLPSADQGRTVAVVAVCVQVCVGILLVRACMLRDEANGTLHRHTHAARLVVVGCIMRICVHLCAPRCQEYRYHSFFSFGGRSCAHARKKPHARAPSPLRDQHGA
nr:hypothetical protein [Pandoravirus massiliensis]